MPLLDSHNHLQRFADPTRIIAEMRAAGISGCVVNGTSEKDWEQVAALATDFPDFVQPAFGLHPWWAHRRTEHWQESLSVLLKRFPQAAVGECGLDGWVEEPTLEIQREVFLPQIALAREHNRPLIIHALKAWEPLFAAFEEEAPPARFLLHSYGGSAELVKRLAPMGAWFSFSGYFLHPKKSKVLEAFKAVPRNRLLLETDAPDMLPPGEFISHPLPEEENHPANLARIAAGLAAALGMASDELLQTTAANHRRFYDID
ncbi:TatD family hydrolase [Haloferula sp. BvORR071]|uniref:TatD family hydrolase n=1 Tax=Haloferula sp. BvORR071 TaxID=1396141 RepID=UPI0005551B83|nr:TatD family hydrolase [Haloferula sp. BvORR071]